MMTQKYTLYEEKAGAMKSVQGSCRLKKLFIKNAQKKGPNQQNWLTLAQNLETMEVFFFFFAPDLEIYFLQL